MEKNTKPQWLIDAENAINEFENTKYGRLSDKEFRFSEKQSNSGKLGGTKAKNSGQLHDALEKAKEYWKNNPDQKKEIGSRMGTVQGNINKETGFISELGKEYGKIQGKKNVDSGHLQNILPDAIAASIDARINKRIKNMQSIFDALPEYFTNKMLKQECINQGFTKHYAKHIMHANLDKFFLYKEGVNGSSKDVPIYKKKGA